MYVASVAGIVSHGQTLFSVISVVTEYGYGYLTMDFSTTKKLSEPARPTIDNIKQNIHNMDGSIL